VTSQLLVDFWDQQLPKGGIFTRQADEELLDHLRDRSHVFTAESMRLKEELSVAKAATNDRAMNLENTRRELVERTADLVATRKLLIERTETTHRELVERTADLVATRELLIERTATLEQMVEQVESLRKELLAAKTRLAQN
jgi:uncharacterized protein YfdQ (DUF2303 family)